MGMEAIGLQKKKQKTSLSKHLDGETKTHWLQEEEGGGREKEQETYHPAEVPLECCMHCLTVQWKASYTPQHFPRFFSLGLSLQDFVLFVCLFSVVVFTKAAMGNFLQP